MGGWSWVLLLVIVGVQIVEMPYCILFGVSMVSENILAVGGSLCMGVRRCIISYVGSCLVSQWKIFAVFGDN